MASSRFHDLWSRYTSPIHAPRCAPSCFVLLHARVYAYQKCIVGDVVPRDSQRARILGKSTDGLLGGRLKHDEMVDSYKQVPSGSISERMNECMGGEGGEYVALLTC